MADVTTEVELTQDWAEISQGLVDNVAYILDFSNASLSATIYWVVVDDAAVEPTIQGHPIGPEARKILAASLSMTPQSDRRYMMRVGRGTAKIIITVA